MREKLSTSNEILAVANLVLMGDKAPFRSLKVMGKQVDGFDVYLPKYLDQTAAYYGEWLLSHPHPDVTCHFTRSDINPED